jgi:hypothetical protein
MGLHGLLWTYLYFIYVDDVRTSHETYRSPWSVTGIALPFYFFTLCELLLEASLELQ